MKIKTAPMFPEVKVSMANRQGNSFAVVAASNQAMADAGVSVGMRRRFADEAMSGDYDHAVATAMNWVDVEEEETK